MVADRSEFDRRITPAREDLAAEALRGRVDAPRYVAPTRHLVRAREVGLWPAPDATGPFDTQILYGEAFDVLDIADGWAWGQSPDDGYVGYVPLVALEENDAEPDHMVRTLRARLYAEPRLKQPPDGRLPYGARVSVVERDDSAEGYAKIESGHWVPAAQLRALSEPAPDWVDVARMFVGVPYVWGGRTANGVDCSGLLQLARQAAGHACPRDSDMQARELGEDLPPDAELRRGDLVFWRGHVGILSGPGTLLHANAYHMAVAEEPVMAAIERIGAGEFGQVTRRARLDATLVRD